MIETSMRFLAHSRGAELIFVSSHDENLSSRVSSVTNMDKVYTYLYFYIPNYRIFTTSIIFFFRPMNKY